MNELIVINKTVMVMFPLILQFFSFQFSFVMTVFSSVLTFRYVSFPDFD